MELIEFVILAGKIKFSAENARFQAINGDVLVECGFLGEKRGQKFTKIYKNQQLFDTFLQKFTKINRFSALFRTFFTPMFISYAYDCSLFIVRGPLLVSRHCEEEPKQSQSNNQFLS